MTSTAQAPKGDLQAQLAELPTTSARIRYLHANGMSKGDISRALNIRYQHVRNVLLQPLKKG
jgi:hypothetical protein